MNLPSATETRDFRPSLALAQVIYPSRPLSVVDYLTGEVQYFLNALFGPITDG
jgi:hypothetical protein